MKMSNFVTQSFKFIGVVNKYQLHVIKRYQSAVPKLSPYDVNLILRANEFSQNDFAEGSVKGYDSNQLPSNSPMEDSRSEASCIHTSGFLVGVFDGHAGHACGQVSAKRIMRYIATSLVPPEKLKYHLQNNSKSYSFLKCYNDKLEFVPEIRDIYEQSFARFAHELINQRLEGFQMHQNLENAFLRLDQDMSEEALQYPSIRTLSVAMSGSVACVAHIEGNQLHVANVGDCSAVLGSISDTGQWVSKKLTIEHNSENINEVRRIISEHPNNEKDTVIRLDRLLGQLAPLRALGDFRYKWSKEILEKLVVPHYGDIIPSNYLTPPYLSAQPEIQHHVLTPRDRFLVIGSDGLWDLLSPMQVIRLVGEHMTGKLFLQPLQLPQHDVTLGEISKILAHRKTGLAKKPLDKNAATHLIRNALGGTEYGIEHSKISHMLSLPQDVVRLFRDDITVTVVYFDTDYLQNLSV